MITATKIRTDREFSRCQFWLCCCQIPCQILSQFLQLVSSLLHSFSFSGSVLVLFDLWYDLLRGYRMLHAYLFFVCFTSMRKTRNQSFLLLVWKEFLRSGNANFNQLINYLTWDPSAQLLQDMRSSNENTTHHPSQNSNVFIGQMCRCDIVMSCLDMWWASTRFIERDTQSKVIVFMCKYPCVSGMWHQSKKMMVTSNVQKPWKSFQRQSHQHAFVLALCWPTAHIQTPFVSTSMLATFLVKTTRRVQNIDRSGETNGNANREIERDRSREREIKSKETKKILPPYLSATQ